jgi:hypothetical protein
MREYAGLPGITRREVAAEAAEAQRIAEQGSAQLSAAAALSMWVTDDASEEVAATGKADAAAAAAAAAAAPAHVATEQGSAPPAALPLSRAQWAVHQPAQLSILVSNVFFCAAVEAALDGSFCAAGALEALARACDGLLADLVRLVRGGLTELQRRVRAGGLQGCPGRVREGLPAWLEYVWMFAEFNSWWEVLGINSNLRRTKTTLKCAVALITIDVRNRDAVRDLLAAGVCSPSDFAWAGALRFEYDADTDGVVARQVNARRVGRAGWGRTRVAGQGSLLGGLNPGPDLIAPCR